MREKTLDLTVDEWMGMYHIAADRADKAEAEVERLKQDMRQFYFDHGLLLGENARLKRVEESAKNLLDSCLEAEAEQGDEEDYIVRLRAENAKLLAVANIAKVIWWDSDRDLFEALEQALAELDKEGER